MMDQSQCPAHTRTPWGTSDHRYDYRLRYASMGILSLVVIAVIVVGVVFLVSTTHRNTDDNLPNLGQHNVMLENSEVDMMVYYPPFRDCGDQLEDCQLFFKPDYCCPPKMRCHETKFSPSGVYCSEEQDTCSLSKRHVASCPGDSIECGEEMGGGCCPRDTTCSPDGCLEVSDNRLGGSKMLVHLKFPHLFSARPQGVNLTTDGVNLTARNDGVNLTLANDGVNLTTDGVNLTANTFLNLDEGEDRQLVRTDTFTPTAPPQTTFTGIKFGEVCVNSGPQSRPASEMNIPLLIVFALAYWFSL